MGRWLRRSRDLGSRSHSLSRYRVHPSVPLTVLRLKHNVSLKCGIRVRPLVCRERVAEGRTAESSQADPRNYSFRFSVQIQRDPELHSHGLALSRQTPILVQDVSPGRTKHRGGGTDGGGGQEIWVWIRGSVGGRVCVCVCVCVRPLWKNTEVVVGPYCCGRMGRVIMMMRTMLGHRTTNACRDGVSHRGCRSDLLRPGKRFLATSLKLYLPSPAQASVFV